MKANRKLILLIILALAIVFTVAEVFPILIFSGGLKIEAKKAKQGQVRLLSETDYKVLLQECRGLAGRVAIGDLKPGDYAVRGNPAPEALQFPQSILDLEPTSVMIDPEGEVTLELFGMFHSFGVTAFPKGCEGHGEIKLIDELWYYDDHYNRYPEYREYIDSLIEKGKRMQSREEHGHP